MSAQSQLTRGFISSSPGISLSTDGRIDAYPVITKFIPASIGDPILSSVKSSITKTVEVETQAFGGLKPNLSSESAREESSESSDFGGINPDLTTESPLEEIVEDPLAGGLIPKN